MTTFRRPIHAGFVMLALITMFVAGCGRHTARVNTPPAPARIGSTETGVASWYGIPYDGRRAASGEIYDMRQLTAAHRSLPFQTWVEVTNLSNGKQVDVRINDRGPFVKGRIVDLSQAAARDIDMLRAGTARVRLKVIPRPNTPLNIPPNEPPREPSREPVEIATSSARPDSARTAPFTDLPIVETDQSVSTPSATTPPSPANSLGASTVETPSAAAPRESGYAVQAGAFSDLARAESLQAILHDLFGEARIAATSGRTPPLWRVIVGREMTRAAAAELAIRVRRETGTAVVVRESDVGTDH